MAGQPEVTVLTDDERFTLLRLVAKVGYKRTGTEVFESFFPILPMVPSEQAVVRTINSVPYVLMWHRSDEHYTGWHMPGGYMLFGETDWQWCERVLKKEADLKLTKVQFIRRFNMRPETGFVPSHQMAHFFLCEAEGEPTKGKFFPLTAIPEDTLGHHKYYIDCLRAHFMRMEMMRRDGIHWDHSLKVYVERSWILHREDRTPVDEKSIMRSVSYTTLDDAVQAHQYVCKQGWLARVFDDQGLQIL